MIPINWIQVGEHQELKIYVPTKDTAEIPVPLFGKHARVWWNHLRSCSSSRWGSCGSKRRTLHKLHLQKHQHAWTFVGVQVTSAQGVPSHQNLMCVPSTTHPQLYAAFDRNFKQFLEHLSITQPENRLLRATNFLQQDWELQTWGYEGSKIIDCQASGLTVDRNLWIYEDYLELDAIIQQRIARAFGVGFLLHPKL